MHGLGLVNFIIGMFLLLTRKVVFLSIIVSGLVVSGFGQAKPGDGTPLQRLDVMGQKLTIMDSRSGRQRSAASRHSKSGPAGRRLFERYDVSRSADRSCRHAKSVGF